MTCRCSKKTKVAIIESERGWGQRVDEIREFDSRADAEKFVETFNARNNLPQAPDWYEYAEITE
jgi:hypothetical protein